MEETVNISTKYPEIVEAAQKQGIKVSDVFAKCKDVDGDGIVDASYPMVKLVNSQIPRTDDGTIIFDVGRLSAAKAYSVKNHESEDVVDKIDNAAESMRDLKSIDLNGNGIPDYLETGTMEEAAEQAEAQVGAELGI